jgi:hypothetical protein
MKGILCACLLVSLHPVAQAYEADVHFSTTYVLARAVGWSEDDALTIASANQGVDENLATVAALEVDPMPGPSFAGYAMSSLHQARQNLEFHCFSRTRGTDGRISADVREVMSGHFAVVPDDDADPRANTRRLIALGAALHCQQDAYAHAGFGGSCGSYAGSCSGHSYETFLDQVVFGLLKRHYYNPDHPGVSGESLFDALQKTVRELSVRRRRPSLRVIRATALVALSDALRASGLDLADDVRIECNRYIAGKWLFDFLGSARDARNNRPTVETLAPDVAATCRNPSLAAATIIRIPKPRFPRLNADASPHLVRTDGSYEQVRGGYVGSISGERTSGHLPEPDSRKASLQLSHWSQLLALPLFGQTLRSANDAR